jgi:hypothetical protein
MSLVGVPPQRQRINSSWSLPPASAAGRQGAAAHVRVGSPSRPAAMSVNGLTVEQARKLAADRAAASRSSENTAAAELFATQAQAAAALKQHLDAVNAHADELTEQGHRAAVAGFADSAPARAAAAAPTAACERLAAATQHVAEIRKAIAAPSDSLSADRAERRNEARLAASDNAVQTARELFAAASNAVELSAAVEAVEAHNEANGLDGSWVNAELARKVPELADALAAEREAAKVQAVVEVNAQRLQRAIADGTPLSVPLTAI